MSRVADNAIAFSMTSDVISDVQSGSRIDAEMPYTLHFDAKSAQRTCYLEQLLRREQTFLILRSLIGWSADETASLMDRSLLAVRHYNCVRSDDTFVVGDKFELCQRERSST